MSDFNQLQDTLNLEESDMKTVPPMLNVLTILTYIGCGFGFLGAIYSFFTVCQSAKKLNDLDTDVIGSGTLGKMMDGAIDMAIKQCDNKTIILIITILATALCVFGAIQMRGLKKQGFIIYCIGELLLPIATIVLLGGASMMGALMITGLIIPIVFIILYATQLKFLKN
jgi:hypothetical protein